jgi:hypothetical protein
MAEYLILPNNIFIERNSRVASQAISMAVMQTFYPLFCKDLSSPAEYWHAAPVTDLPPEDGTILMLVRDPVDRFLSAVSVGEITVAEALDGLDKSNSITKDPHFEPQASDIATQIYKYPSELPEFCAAAGLPYPLSVVNESAEKEALTKEQKAAVEKYYAADVALFKGI